MDLLASSTFKAPTTNRNFLLWIFWRLLLSRLRQPTEIFCYGSFGVFYFQGSDNQPKFSVMDLLASSTFKAPTTNRNFLLWTFWRLLLSRLRQPTEIFCYGPFGVFYFQ